MFFLWVLDGNLLFFEVCVCFVLAIYGNMLVWWVLIYVNMEILGFDGGFDMATTPAVEAMNGFWAASDAMFGTHRRLRFRG